ncbi:helix-turn-helix domain-containing protein [Thermogemmatispora carboxidivorans]|uniref:helix-turn-helix domain-containing protein n=1 Tax=Thermogemmatispora carboxidivorans TaxID=1382306 RepID=UPI0009E0429E
MQTCTACRPLSLLAGLPPQRGISMSKLSRMSDISFSTITRICNDPSYSPTVHTLEQLAKALGLRVALRIC